MKTSSRVKEHLNYLNHALISLIPKCEGASQDGSFPPIILNGSCKIITKGRMLTDGKKRSISYRWSSIGIHQRQYHAWESRICTRNSCRLPFHHHLVVLFSLILFKKELALHLIVNSYWTCSSLLAKRFWDKWICWISSCSHSATSTVVVNGVLGRQFSCKGGLTQK